MTLLVSLLLTPLAAADEVNIVLWNSERLFDVATVYRRAYDLREFGVEFANADIIILDEVTSLPVVNAVRNAMGFSGYHTACSDFAQDDHDTFNSLEVGFISRFRLRNVVEYDPSPDNSGTIGEPGEIRLERVNVSGIARTGISRGFLTADVPDLGMTLVAAHLKSSRGSAGEADHDNARQREFVAAAIARFVARKLQADRMATVLVAGDMNVGETDRAKNGVKLAVDHYDSHAGDLYDDTHAIFSAGLIDQLRMKSLTRNLGTETYDDAQFRGAGPIDCLYVAGKRTGDFAPAQKSQQTFGSDHFAVSTRLDWPGVLAAAGMVVRPSIVEPSMSVETGQIQITALLPNPKGIDDGNEWVLLQNCGDVVVDLIGWQLRDAAGNGVKLAGVLRSGEEMKVHLSRGQLPLNNNGDVIHLLDRRGRQVHRVRYGGEQVAAGRVLSFGP